MLVVPTAAAHQRPEKAAANGAAYFSKLGADASALMVLNKADANDATLCSVVDTADLVYLTGGSPIYLLDSLKNSRLVERIEDSLERGAVLVGSSAGAMVMGGWMRDREWTRALELVPNILMLPHHENADPETVSRELTGSTPDGAVVLGIDARTGILSGPDGWTVLGVGGVTVYVGGEWQRYEAGETVPPLSVNSHGH